MYSPEALIKHLDSYISELKHLILDESAMSFKEEHSNQLKMIESYRGSLEVLDGNARLTLDHIREGLGLMEHPEGGFYREFIRSPSQTVIFYLLTQGSVSSWHSLKSTREEFMLLVGSPLVIEKIGSDGEWKSREEADHAENVVIEKDGSGGFGDWFGGYTNGEYALVTCQCTGPFEFENFKLAGKRDLDVFLRRNCGHKDIIDRLSPK